jgi:dienelactone hydrolase
MPALLLLLAGAVAVLAIVLEGSVLPRPSGAYPVGTTTLVLVRPQSAAGERPGTFAVTLWYPSRPSSDRALYGTGEGGFRERLYRLLVRTHATRDGALAAAAAPFPVLVYVAGWGGRRTDNTALAEDLASHGFVIAAFDDIGFDRPPEPALLGPADFSSQRAYDATLALASKKLRAESRRASYVLDRVLALGAEPGNRFEGRLDQNRAGIYGFSLGGAVALETCRRDARFGAAMNLDGLLFDAGTSPGETHQAPYFLVSDAGTAPTEEDLTASDPGRRLFAILETEDIRSQHAVLLRGGYSLRISGAEHLSFTDAALYSPLERFRGRAIDPQHVARVIGRYALAFFETALNGRPSPLFLESERDPGIAFERWSPGGAAGIGKE